MGPACENVEHNYLNNSLDSEKFSSIFANTIENYTLVLAAAAFCAKVQRDGKQPSKGAKA